MNNQHKNKISVAEIRILYWMCSKTRHDRIRNGNIKDSWGSTDRRNGGGNLAYMI